MYKKQNALVIAGGQWQVPIIQFLKNKNCRVFVADPLPSAPGVLIADAHIRADVRDFKKIKKLISNKKIDIITTDQSDIAVPAVAELAWHFKLPGNDPKAVEKFTNKFISRQYALSQKIPVPQFHSITSINQVEKIISTIGLPVILKPADSQSSRGIFKIDNTNVDQVLQLGEQTFKASYANYILVEKFFSGIELTAEGICSNKKHKTLAISMKKHFRTGIASDLEYSAKLPSHIEKNIIKYNDQYIENSGINFGITHAEYLYNKKTEKICLVEIACRGGGTLISSDIVKWVSGIDVYEILFNDLNGIPTDLNSLQIQKNPALLHFFEFPNGIVEKISGLEELISLPNIKTLKLDFTEGDYIKAATDDRSRQGFVIIYGKNKNILKNTLNIINKKLQVTVSQRS